MPCAGRVSNSREVSELAALGCCCGTRIFAPVLYSPLKVRLLPHIPSSGHHLQHGHSTNHRIKKQLLCPEARTGAPRSNCPESPLAARLQSQTWNPGALAAGPALSLGRKPWPPSRRGPETRAEIFALCPPASAVLPALGLPKMCGVALGNLLCNVFLCHLD